MAGPVAMEKLTARLINAFVCMRAKIVALGLEQVSGQTLISVLIEKGESGAEGGNRDAFFGRGRDDIAPGTLRVFDGLSEERIEQQVR